VKDVLKLPSVRLAAQGLTFSKKFGVSNFGKMGILTFSADWCAFQSNIQS
jgi:hypothetical protein